MLDKLMMLVLSSLVCLVFILFGYLFYLGITGGIDKYCSPAEGPVIETQIDNCKLYVYKPRCNGHVVHFTNCKGSTSYQQHDGKVYRTIEVPGN